MILNVRAHHEFVELPQSCTESSTITLASQVVPDLGSPVAPREMPLPGISHSSVPRMEG